MTNNSQPTKPIVITEPCKPHEEALPVDPEEVAIPTEDPDYDLIPDELDETTPPYEPPSPVRGLKLISISYSFINNQSTMAIRFKELKVTSAAFQNGHLTF